MGRLIDADKVRNEYIHAITLEMDAADLLNMLCDIIDNAPTVDAIPKADYENRLKADLEAMLTELKNELTDISWNIDMYDDDLDFECCYLNDIDEVIQQKINSLKEA